MALMINCLSKSFADNISEAERDVGDQIQVDTLYQGVHYYRWVGDSVT